MPDSRQWGKAWSFFRGVKMLSNKALQLVLEESETMVIEWADTMDGFGLDKIENKLKTFFKDKELTELQIREIKFGIRQFIKNDMEIIQW